MGLKEILSEINEQSREESELAINTAKANATRLLMEKSEELDQFYHEKRVALDADLARRKKKLFAKAELSAERESHSEESRIIRELMDDAFEELCETITSNEEKNLAFLIRQIRRSMDILGSDEIIIRLSAHDEKLFPKLQREFGKKISLGETANIRGGAFIVHGRHFVDSSLGSTFNRNRPLFLEWTSNVLSENKTAGAK